MRTIERIAPSSDLTSDVLDARVDDGGSFPIVDAAGCTFAYRGAVISVRLTHFGVGFPEDLDFEQVDDSDWWLLALDVPHGSRLEYKLEVTDSFGTTVVEDPLNDRHASHPFGANSVCEAAGYAEPRWVVSDPDVPAGRLVEFELESAALGRTTTTSVYLPAGFTTDGEGRYPLLVVHDGSDYLAYASAATVLDNLIHGGDIPPAVVALVRPLERLTEYADDPCHAEHLTAELVPALEKDLPLVATPAGRCLIGASFGAVASLSAAWRAPGFFGRLLLQSGSFAGAGTGCRRRPEPLWRPVRQFVRAYLAQPAAVAERVFVTCGAYESLICENRGLVPVLERTGMAVRFAETLDGHNWACWRDSLGVALPWLLTDDGPRGLE